MGTTFGPLRAKALMNVAAKNALRPSASKLVLFLLRERSKTASAQRVERILELIVKAEELRAKIRRVGMPPFEGPIGGGEFDSSGGVHSPVEGFHCSFPFFHFLDPRIEKINIEYHETIRELQKLLIRYEWRPTVEDVLYHRLDQEMLWKVVKSPEENVENRAVQYLLRELDRYNRRPKTAEKRLFRFRRCKECNQWFDAVTTRRIYCSASCKKRHASHDPEFKKERAKYMRETYRPGQKERDQQALEQVRKPSNETKKRG
jgi:hypothetical protein